MAYTTAQALLEEFWDCRLPVDPAYFAERLGLTVKYSGVSGFLCLGRLFQGQPNEAALCI